MGIAIQTPLMHDVCWSVSDYNRANDTLGFPMVIEEPNLFIMMTGSTAVAIRRPENGTSEGDTFNPFPIGLDQLALACDDEVELNWVAQALQEAHFEDTGVKTDETLGKITQLSKIPTGFHGSFICH